MTNFSASVTLPSGETATIELGDQTDWSLRVTPITDETITLARAYMSGFDAGNLFANHIGD